jgi:hypothetical protein
MPWVWSGREGIDRKRDSALKKGAGSRVGGGIASVVRDAVSDSEPRVTWADSFQGYSSNRIYLEMALP